MKYLVCYDIAEPKRLYRIAKELNANGYRVQKSFFTCELSNSEFEKLRDMMIRFLNKEEDKLAIYKVCDKCAEGGHYIGCSLSQFFLEDYLIL